MSGCHSHSALPACPCHLKLCFIVNPRSGRARRALSAITTFAQARGANLVFTERPRHASDLARDALAQGCEVIAAVGGDGTMNEVASVLTGTTATLALVPCGSGNGLGRHLGIHGPTTRALDIIAHGRTQLIDTGCAAGRTFFSVAGLGFEAVIAARFNQLVRRGFLRYLATSARGLLEYQPIECVVEFPGHRERVTAFTLAVANAAQYGNNARIAPAARIDDGRLNLTVVPPLTWLNTLPLCGRLFTGRLAHTSLVLQREATHFVVERASAGPLHVDGEVFDGPARVEFTVKPRSLRIKVAPHP